MAYQSYFPIGYQPYQYGNQYTTPILNAYQAGQNIQPQQQIAPQAMTPPTIHADMIVVPGEQTAKDYPVGAGETQMFITSDEGAIFAKTASKNGQVSFVSYDRRPDAPPEPKFNPSEYVRKDEVEALFRSFAAQASSAKPVSIPPEPTPARKSKKEGTDE